MFRDDFAQFNRRWMVAAFARLVIEADGQLHRPKIAFRRCVDNLERDEIGFAHFYGPAVADNRHRLAQLLGDSRPKIDATLGAPL